MYGNAGKPGSAGGLPLLSETAMQQSPVPQRQNRALCAHPSPAPVRLTEANREAYTNVTVM